jgi:hypothetical protein
VAKPPRELVVRGGVTYLLTVCGVDGVEKAFRLERIRWVEVIS